MKRLNIILSIIAAIMLLIYLIIHIGGTLTANIEGMYTAASDYQDDFETVQSILNKGSAAQLFAPEIPSSSTDTYLLTLNVHLSNNKFLNTEWIDCSLDPASGDIAVYSVTGTGSDLSPGEDSTITLKIITRTPEEKRKVVISYYVMGGQRKIILPI